MRKRMSVSGNTGFENSFRVVTIPKQEFALIRRIRPFEDAIAMVRKSMAQGGLNYDLPFISWVDAGGNLCHQNFLKGGRLQAQENAARRAA